MEWTYKKKAKKKKKKEKENSQKLRVQTTSLFVLLPDSYVRELIAQCSRTHEQNAKLLTVRHFLGITDANHTTR